MLQEYYRQAQPHTRLGSLVLHMLKRPGEPAKLRAKAGETRCLVDFAWQEASRVAQHGASRRWELLLAATAALHHLSAMVKVWPWPKEVAVGHVRCLMRAWGELAALDEGLFRIRPKFHLLHHLVSEVAPTHGPPALFWCYQDEDWGGQAAKVAARRGGHKSPVTTASRTLCRLLALL